MMENKDYATSVIQRAIEILNESSRHWADLYVWKASFFNACIESLPEDYRPEWRMRDRYAEKEKIRQCAISQFKALLQYAQRKEKDADFKDDEPDGFKARFRNIIVTYRKTLKERGLYDGLSREAYSAPLVVVHSAGAPAACQKPDLCNLYAEIEGVLANPLSAKQQLELSSIKSRYSSRD